MRKVCRSSRPTFLLPGAARVAWVRAEFSGEMNALFIVPFWLRLPCDLRYPLQDRFAGKEFYVLGEPPPPHDPLLIHEEERPPCNLPVWIAGIRLKAAVTPNNPQVWMVAEERERELERIGKRLLRKGVVGADSKNLDTQILEFLEVGLPGR